MGGAASSRLSRRGAGPQTWLLRTSEVVHELEECGRCVGCMRGFHGSSVSPGVTLGMMSVGCRAAHVVPATFWWFKGLVSYAGCVARTTHRAFGARQPWTPVQTTFTEGIRTVRADPFLFTVVGLCVWIPVNIGCWCRNNTKEEG